MPSLGGGPLAFSLVCLSVCLPACLFCAEGMGEVRRGGGSADCKHMYVCMY